MIKARIQAESPTDGNLESYSAGASPAICFHPAHYSPSSLPL